MPEDYILRLIEQAGQMLAAIVADLLGGRREEAARKIEAQSVQIIGLTMKAVKHCSPEVLWERLQQGGGLCYPRAVMLAELLLKEAEVSRAAHLPGEAIASEFQAFCLLAETIDVLSSADAAVYRPRLETLARDLERASNHAYLQEKIAAYRARTNRPPDKA